jgi:quinol monooxygenase YgiN
MATGKHHKAIIPQGQNSMRTFLGLTLGAVIPAAMLVNTAHAQNGALYVVTYVEVMPNAAAPAAMLLKSYRDVSREEVGNIRLDVLQEMARPNRFVVLEVWSGSAARDAHLKATGVGELVERLKAIENAPPDVRLNNGLYLEPTEDKSPPDPVYVVTHVDVVPASKDNCVALLGTMTTDTHSDPGNIGYDVLQQANRSNHFTVVEEWANRKALDGHAMAAHTIAFREKLSPMAGALFDERFYAIVR